MDIARLEEIVGCSVQEGPFKAEATRQLDLLRADPNRWAVGIRMFQESRQDMVRFCGLSLVRDFLASPAAADQPSSRRTIREATWTWLEVIVTSGAGAVAPYIFNNVLSITTLCIKRDYPEHWPTAFDDLLALAGKHEVVGGEVIIKLLNELEVEVIMFNEGRTKEEIAHNTFIKDRMRETDTILKIVGFLCHLIQQGSPPGVPAAHSALAAKGLLCLSELIGWTDMQLITTHALAIIYAALESIPAVAGAALTCVLEIAKKGMDPLLKMRLLHSISLVPCLLSKQFTSRWCLGGGNGSGGAGSEESRAEEVQALRQYALSIDMICVEGLGVWMRFEDLAVVPTLSNTPTEGIFGDSGSEKKASRRKRGEASAGLEELVPVLGCVSEMLTVLVPQLLILLRHNEIQVATGVLPAVNKFIQLLRSQKAATQLLGRPPAGPSGECFITQPFVDDLLLALHSQSQLPEDFDFEALEEEDQEALDIMEAKSEARKLFLQCSRSHGQRCLELLAHFLSQLSPSLAKATCGPLEATLRLLQGFPEAEDREAQVPRIVQQLYNTDVCAHEHPQVQLALYELSLRWTRGSDVSRLDKLAMAACSAVLQQAAKRETKYNQSLRTKLTQILLKYCDVMEEYRSQLLPLAQPVIEMLVQNRHCVVNERLVKGAVVRSNVLTEGAECALLEVLAVITSTPQAQREQVQLLEQCVNFLSASLQTILQHYTGMGGSEDAMEKAVVHHVSCVSVLLKHVPAQSAAHQDIIQRMQEGMVYLLQHFIASVSVRQRCVQFLHHLIEKSGTNAPLLGQALDLLVGAFTSGDCETVVGLFAQLCVQCEAQAGPVITRYHSALMARIAGILADFERNAGAAVDNSPVRAAVVAGVPEPAHVEVERVALTKHILAYLHALLAHGQAETVLRGGMAGDGPEQVFMYLLNSVRGLSASGALVSKSLGLPQRRSAILCVHVLLEAVAGNEPLLAVAVSYTHDQFLPLVLLMMGEPRLGCTRPGLYTTLVRDYDQQRLNLQDAASHGVVAEVATLLHVLARWPTSLVYVRGLLTTQLAWEGGLCDALLGPLTGAVIMPLGGFKDHLRQFVRTYL